MLVFAICMSVMFSCTKNSGSTIFSLKPLSMSVVPIVTLRVGTAKQCDVMKSYLSHIIYALVLRI